MFDNLDPKQQAMLMMAAGLLSPQPRNMGRGAQFAGALSQGIQGGLLGFNQASQEKRRAEIMAQEAALRKAQLAGIEREEQFRNALTQGFQPGGMNDDPSSMTYGQTSPAGFDISQAMKVDPLKALQVQQSMQPKPMVVPEGAAVLGPDNKPLYTNPKAVKPDKPKFVPGDIQEIKIGRQVITREMQSDGTWKEIGKSSMDKPEGNGMAKPPFGWEYAPDGSIRYTKGGPHDPAVVAKVEPEAIKTDAARARVDKHLDTIQNYYTDLQKKGAAVSTALPARSNIANRLAASSTGQAIGGALGTEEQSIRNKIKSMRPLLIQEIRSATGMSAKAMDSNAELQFYLQAATDPTFDVEANLSAIAALRAAYGVGKAQDAPAKSSGGFRVLGRE